MSDQPPARDPGHLDVDAVSAFVDRDFDPVELAAIEVHLARCPACQREVLEIRTTVLLLGALPQYEPRRSFRLGQEHARAGRRRAHLSPSPAWQPPALSPGQPATITGETAVSRQAGWLATMQVAAMVVGALLLLVTVGDLQGLVPQAPSPMQLAAPTAAAELPQEALVPAPAAAPTATLLAMPQAAAPEAVERQDQDQAAVDGAAPPAPAAFETAFQQAPSASGGTERGNSASEEMPADGELAQPAARAVATSAAAAAVTQAIPTPGAANASTGGGAAASKSAAPATAANGAQPSRLRIVQLALALLLAWLVVSIAGLRWVRRTG